MANINWNDFATKDAGYSFNRTNPIPTDKTSVYSSLSEAQTYASTSPVAYDGQTISVVTITGEGDSESVDVKLYLIQNKALIPVSGDADAVLNDPWEEYSEDETN